MKKILKPTYLSDKNESSFDFTHGSRLVYGCSGLGGVWGETDYQESVDCLLYAFEQGVNSVDTAPSYNVSQQIVGKALAQWKGDKPFISTKVGRLQSADAHTTVVDYTPETMYRSIMESLETLGISSIDLLFIHEPQLVPLDQIDSIIEYLKTLQQKGLFKLLGVGGNPTQEFYPYLRKDNFSVVSCFLKVDASNLSGFEKDIPRIQEEQMAYYAASALHFSLLGNRFQKFVDNPPNDGWISDRDISNAQKVNAIANREGMKLSSLAQRFLFSLKQANRVVIGARKMNQIESSVADWKAGVLPENLFNEIITTIEW